MLWLLWIFGNGEFPMLDWMVLQIFDDCIFWSYEIFPATYVGCLRMFFFRKTKWIWIKFQVYDRKGQTIKNCKIFIKFVIHLRIIIKLVKQYLIFNKSPIPCFNDAIKSSINFRYLNYQHSHYPLMLGKLPKHLIIP